MFGVLEIYWNVFDLETNVDFLVTVRLRCLRVSGLVLVLEFLGQLRVPFTMQKLVPGHSFVYFGRHGTFWEGFIF